MTMNLHEIVRGVALEQPLSVEMPFAGTWQAFKIRGKWFALLGALNGKQIVSVKVDPFDGERLRETYEGITPGYHMNKKHWITITEGMGVPEDLIRELVEDSYRLVSARKRSL